MELLDRLHAQWKFLYASSSAIYSGLQKDAFTENDVGTTNTLHPRACYIEGKRCGEAIVNAYREGGRIYCYISDAVELLWKILLFGKSPIYNVGGEEQTSILDIAHIIGEILHAEVVLPDVSIPLAGNATCERIDMSATLKEFPIRFCSLREGLRKTIAWYQYNYGNQGGGRI